MVYRLGELFCGPGGLAYGAMTADIGGANSKIIHAWANDIDSATCQTFAKNIFKNPYTDAVICEDVRNLELSEKNLAAIDAFSFGFPCNDFSVVGEQKGFNGTYGALYTYGVEILKIFRPQFFLAENVSGLSSANKGSAFKKILYDLKSVGYKIFPHLYKFEEYGVPQTRHRIIIVGIRADLPQNFFPPSTAPYKNFDVSVRNALTNPPIDEFAFNHEMPIMSEKVVERLKYIKPGQNAFNAEMPDEIKLKVKGAKISQIYKRLDPAKPAYTVTGSGGGGTHMYHYEENRALTNRERARLQTFPDDFEFIGSRENVRRQIGMAVPCRGAKIIFEAILICTWLNYWWVTRPKRKLNSVPEILSVIAENALNKNWNEQRGEHLNFESALERNNLKREGTRIDQTGGVGRTYIAWIMSLGLIFSQQATKNLQLTLAGKAILDGESPVKILTNQILKYQFPSSFSLKVKVSERFKIHPFQFMLKILSDRRIGYLTQEEIAKIIITEAENESAKCYEKIIARLLEFRNFGDSCLEKDFAQKYTSSKGTVNFEKPFAHLLDIANTIINWLEYTQFIFREDGKMKILDEQAAEVQKIITH